MEHDSDEVEVITRKPITRRATKIEWTLMFALFMQAAALIWGAAKLTSGVEQLNNNMDKMSDYSVLRFRVEQNERAINNLQARIESQPRR